MGHTSELTWQQLAVLTSGRLVLNTAFRIVYPLLPALASGFQVDLQTVSLLVTIQVAATLLSPLGGWISDRYGERTTLLGGLGLFTLGAIGCAFATAFLPFLLSYGLIGLGSALFLPAVQTYASNRSEYGQRARVLGLLELSWALAALLGVTGLTLLGQVTGTWSSAFWALAAVGVVMLLLTAPLPTAPRLTASGKPQASSSMVAVLRTTGVGAAMIFAFIQLMAVELIFVSYGAWLTEAFGASSEQLGFFFGLLGLVELVGALGATLLTDRLGKRRAVLVGFASVGLLLLLLPLSEGNWLLFIPLFLLFGLCFEFSIVSVFPLVSGLSANARGTVLSLTIAMIGVGRIAGSLAGPWILVQFGFWANGLLAGLLALLGVAIGLVLVREGSH